jgi:hypothetical protein
MSKPDRPGWRWRDGELPYKEFLELTSTAKQDHIKMLQQLPKDVISSSEEIILNRYAPQETPDKFLEL